MSETWYRGQSTTVPPSTPGGSIHDFGDGMYLTSSKEVAVLYANTRVAQGGGKPELLSITIDRAELGRVLDLNNDPRWQRYLREPQVPGRPNTTPESLIRMANENYGRLFEAFVAKNKIDMRQYDAVIGPEFVRGGTQLAILHRNGQPSNLAKQIRARLSPVGAPAQARTAVPVVSGRSLAQSGVRGGIVSNKAAMAILGQALGSAIQAVGDIGIRRRIQQEIEITHAKSIATILSRGDGVLVIIAMQEWIQPDFNGMRARSLLGVSVQGGHSQEAALQTWHNTPHILQGPAKGWRCYEEYAWIDPRR